MSDVAKFVEKLIAAGCMPKVAAEVVAQVFCEGMQAAPSKDPAAERRRAWDREYRRKRNMKSGGSGGNRVETDPVHVLWTEGVGLLRQLGVAEKRARANIGLWLKTQKPELVLARIREAVRARAGDPIPWVTMSFGAKNGKHQPSLTDVADDLITRAKELEGERGFSEPDVETFAGPRKG